MAVMVAVTAVAAAAAVGLLNRIFYNYEIARWCREMLKNSSKPNLYTFKSRGTASIEQIEATFVFSVVHPFSINLNGADNYYYRVCTAWIDRNLTMICSEGKKRSEARLGAR